MSLSKLKLIGILVIIGLIAYLPSLNNKFVWDDEQFIYKNQYVKTFDVKNIFSQNTIAGAGENSTYYRPLTTLGFAIDHSIWGLNPIGFHLSNTTLHIAASIILFLILIELGISKNISFWISAIFLTHPLQTEAVVYANSRGDSMFIFWALLGIFAFTLLNKKKYFKFSIYNLIIEFNKIVLSILSVLFYLLSILGKEIGLATLGIYFLVFFYFNLQKLIKNKDDLLKLVKEKAYESATLFSLILTAIIYLVFRSKVLNISSSTNFYSPESAYGSSLYVRLHTFTKALWTYFQLIFFPYPLHMERSLEILKEPYSIWLFATIAVVVLIFALGLIEYKKRKKLYIWFGALWFIGMLVPVSGILPINGLIYEHWLYMPIIGFLIFFYGSVNLIFKNKLNMIFKFLLPVITVIYIGLTIRQNYIWGDPIRFYNYTLGFSDSPRLYNNLAMSHAEIGEVEKAIEIYTNTIAIGDYYPQTHHNLGNAYSQLGQFDLAEESFRTAIRMNDAFFPSYAPLINIFLTQERYEEALPLLEELVKVAPDNFDIRLAYLKLLYQTDQLEEASTEAINMEAIFGSNRNAVYLIKQASQKTTTTEN